MCGPLQALRCGVTRLCAEPHLFWSAVLAFHASGSIAPWCPLRGEEPGSARCWGEAASRKEFILLSHNFHPGLTFHTRSKYTQLTSTSGFLWTPRSERAPLPHQGRFAEPIYDPAARGPPRWWRDVAALWDSAFAHAAKGEVPCYFAGGELSCVAPAEGEERCSFFHDDRFLEAAKDLIRAPRVCGHCNAIASVHKCARCKQKFYCGRECQQKDWTVHRRVCNLAGAAPD
jgi:hypothetical protein